MASTAELVSVPLLLDRQTVEQHSLRRQEPQWLRDARLAALTRFTPESWPTGEEEEWRRFPLKDLPEGSLVSSLDHLPAIQFKLEPEAAAQGVIFKGLLRASLDNPELVRPHIAPGDGIPSHAALRAIAEPHRREITAVFLDLRGFTSFTDRADPDEVMDLLRAYHATLGRTVDEYEGTLEHFGSTTRRQVSSSPLMRERSSTSRATAS